MPLLIVIPTYNNRPSLRDVVERALATGYPVLVVNHGNNLLRGRASLRKQHHHLLLGVVFRAGQAKLFERLVVVTEGAIKQSEIVLCLGVRRLNLQGIAKS